MREEQKQLIREKFSRQFVELHPIDGTDLFNRPPLYDTPQEQIDKIIDFWLNELDLAIKQDMEDKTQKEKIIESWYFRTLPVIDLDNEGKEIKPTSREKWIESVKEDVEKLINLAIKQTEERIVEKIEVWQPVESGGEAIREDGTRMKRIAILLDGTPLFLEKNFYIKKQGLSKEESKVLQDNFTLTRNNDKASS